MNLLDALVLGVVEGVTEFLPVSSTGHLIVAADLLNIAPTEFLKSFEIAIQLGAILAIVALYGRKLAHAPKLLGRVLLAFAPTAAVGALLYPVIKAHLLGNTAVVLVALFVGGALLILFEQWYGKLGAGSATPLVGVSSEIPSVRQALLIGIAQSVAIIPGVSRAGATIVGGLLAGLSRTAVVEFSFLLAIPTMAAATAFDLWKNGSAFVVGEWFLLAIGFTASCVSAFFAVRFLLSYIKRHSFTAFGIYRMLAALIFFFLLF